MKNGEPKKARGSQEANGGEIVEVGADAHSSSIELVAPASLEEQKRVLLDIHMERAKIPPKFLGKSLDNFETRGDKTLKAIADMARQYVDAYGKPDFHERPGAILSGPTGSGKTHIMCGILRELISRGHKALFYSLPTLFKDLRSTFDGEADFDEDDLLDQISTVEILALDDLGAEKTSGWVLDRLYLVVNKRYEDCRPLLITTNHAWPDDALRGGIDPRVASRLAEMCRPIGPFPDRDWRLAKAGISPRM